MVIGRSRVWSIVLVACFSLDDGMSICTPLSRNHSMLLVSIDPLGLSSAVAVNSMGRDTDVKSEQEEKKRKFSDFFFVREQTKHFLKLTVQSSAVRCEKEVTPLIYYTPI